MAALDGDRRAYLEDRKDSYARGIAEEQANVKQLDANSKDAKMQLDEAKKRLKNLEADLVAVEQELEQK